MKNKLVSIVIVIILMVGGFLLFKNRGIVPTESEIENDSVSTSTKDNTVVTPPAGPTPTSVNTKEFSVNAASFSFSPSTLIVHKGDMVKITVKNVNGTHDLRIDGFGVSTRRLNTGESETISFLADKSGTFKFYCSVGNHSAMGMVGTLTVQ